MVIRVESLNIKDKYNKNCIKTNHLCNKSFCCNKYNNVDKVSFSALLPKNAKIKLAILDIDETLRGWNSDLSEKEAQNVRNKLFNHFKKNNIEIAYSSDRNVENIKNLINTGVLASSEWIVGSNGSSIYKNVNGDFKEVKAWTEIVTKKFDKQKVRKSLLDFAHRKENMFSKEELANFKDKTASKYFPEFEGSKITEYLGNDSPFGMRIAIPPYMYNKKNIKIISKLFKANKMDAKITYVHYPYEMVTCEKLRSYFKPEVAQDIARVCEIRYYPDKSSDCLIISATNKGEASEYLRKNLLKIKKNSVFSAGDGDNDYSNANKGYYFAIMSNAVDCLKNLLCNNKQNKNLIKTSRPGAEGLLEVFI